jgi:hypothetical protein
LPSFFTKNINFIFSKRWHTIHIIDVILDDTEDIIEEDIKSREAATA